jgi:hypothetical protein
LTLAHLDFKDIVDAGIFVCRGHISLSQHSCKCRYSGAGPPASPRRATAPSHEATALVIAPPYTTQSDQNHHVPEQVRLAWDSCSAIQPGRSILGVAVIA